MSDTLTTTTAVCGCMTEDLRDGLGERVVTHSLSCPAHPDRAPFQAGESFLTFNMSRGHAHRMHHELTGYWQPNGDGTRTLVRTCPCGGAA